MSDKNAENIVLSEDGQPKEISKSALKKKLKQEQEEARKLAKQVAKVKLDTENQQKKVEEINKVVIKLDTSLPDAIQIKIYDRQKYIGQRVKIYGFVHRRREQGLFF